MQVANSSACKVLEETSGNSLCLGTDLHSVSLAIEYTSVTSVISQYPSRLRKVNVGFQLGIQLGITHANSLTKGVEFLGIGYQHRAVSIHAHGRHDGFLVLGLLSLLVLHFLIERLHPLLGQRIIVDTGNGNIPTEGVVACCVGTWIKVHTQTYEDLLAFGIGKLQFACAILSGRNQVTVDIQFACTFLLVPYTHQMNPLAVGDYIIGGVSLLASNDILKVPLAVFNDDAKASAVVSAQQAAPLIVELAVFKIGTSEDLHRHAILYCFQQIVVVRYADVVVRLLAPQFLLIAKNVHAVLRASLDDRVTQHLERIGHWRGINHSAIIIEHNIKHIGLRRLCQCNQSHAEGQESQ